MSPALLVLLPHVNEEPLFWCTSRRTSRPFPYVSIEFCGFGAGGKAGNACSAAFPLPFTGTVLLGLLGAADEGLEFGADVGATQGTVVILPAGCRTGVDDDEEAGGSPGNGLAEDERPEAVPQDLVCDTGDRDD